MARAKRTDDSAPEAARVHRDKLEPVEPDSDGSDVVSDEGDVRVESPAHEQPVAPAAVPPCDPTTQAQNPRLVGLNSESGVRAEGSEGPARSLPGDVLQGLGNVRVGSQGGTPRSAVSQVPGLYTQPAQLPPRPAGPPMGKHVETAEGR